MAPSSRRLKTSQISTIFFDLDNTLIPTRLGDKTACDEVLCILTQRYGIPHSQAATITRDFLTTFRSSAEDEQVSLDEWRCSIWKGVLGVTYQHLAEEIYDLWLELRYHYLQPSEEVLSMLRCLKSQYALALITNGFSRSQWEKIHRLHMEDYFQCILVSGDQCWEKPYKGIFLLACDQLQTSPQECMMVGDRLDTDILGAVNAGLGASVWIPLEDTHNSQVHVSPDATISIVTLLPALLSPVKQRPSLSRYLDLSEPDSENSNCSES